MDKKLVDDIKTIFWTVVIGECTKARCDRASWAEASALKAYLDSVKEYAPGFFWNKDAILEVLAGVSDYYSYFSEQEDLANYNWFMKIFFSSYVDKSLMQDKDVVMAMLKVIDLYAENKHTLTPCLELSSLCYEVPHEILMDNQVFELLLDKLGPFEIYSEILTDKERLNDDIVYKLLKWYCHLHQCFTLNRTDRYVDNIKALHEAWVQTIRNSYLESEISTDIYESTTSREAMKFFSFVDEFLDIIYEVGSEYPYHGETETSIIKKRLLFGEKMIDMDINRNMQVKEKILHSTCDEEENYFLYESFFEILEPYQNQMRLFDALEENNYAMFGVAQADGEKGVDLESEGGEGGYLKLPGVGNFDGIIPF